MKILRLKSLISNFEAACVLCLLRVPPHLNTHNIMSAICLNTVGPVECQCGYYKYFKIKYVLYVNSSILMMVIA